MKIYPSVSVATKSLLNTVIRIHWWRLCALLLLPGAPAGRAAEPQAVHSPVAAVVTNLSAVRHSPLWNRLNLSLGLPLRDREGLTNLLHQLYDPASTNFHQFLTPEQFTERFGPAQKDYDAVVAFARAHGLEITALHSNRTLVSVRGTVAAAERAFHVKLNEYQHPTEARTFFAPDRVPSVDLATPLLAVGGLDNFIVPRPCRKPMAAAQPEASLTGSGPNGAFLGNDFRAAYVPGVPLTGTGQTVGLLEFDSGYYQSDITAYETLAGLPNVPVSTVLLDGYNGAAGSANDEVSLDIEMAIAMAPGLEQVIVYEGSSTDDILNRMATDNLAKQIGASWGYGIDATTEQIFLQFAAQGQSFFNASGDSDAYSGAIMTPSDDPNITIVGGTTLTTTGPGGPWAAETVWNWGGGTGSSGGISTTYPIPAWQQGISMTANQGSTTMRNMPDVALTADNIYVLYGNGKAGVFGGTSCATPLWAAFTALVNQLALTNGEPLAGFINPAVYSMGKGSNALGYASLFHDITTGNNESTTSPRRFSAVAGYDLCTGWGTPVGDNLVTALALPEALRVAPAETVVFTGPVGGPFSPPTQNYTLTNYATESLNWTVGSPSPWFNVSTNSGSVARGGPSATVTIRWLDAATNLPAGRYAATLRFTNLNDHFVQTRPAVLDIVTPPVITAPPANQALLAGMTANFSVSVGANALMFYCWQENGTNLTDGGQISGATTSTLTISDVTATNIGSYSVIVSNAAGVLASSNALLTIVSSAPVIVLQPTNQGVLPGAPASFSVAAVGDRPYACGWQFNGTNLTDGDTVAGATGTTLTLSNVSAANVGVYSVIVSNALGYASSTGAVLSLIPVTAPGVSLTIPLSFSGTSGLSPYSPLVQGKDGSFYGTTLEGGSIDQGNIFKWSTNGLFTNLYSFGLTLVQPYGGLFQGRDNNLYGATASDVFRGNGAVFRITTDGHFSELAGFNGPNGANPLAGMIQGNDGNFYGTTLQGGAYGYGTVYRLTNGTLTTLAAFDSTDGAYPSAVLAPDSDGNFYGTTENGGTNGLGTVFKLTPAGILTRLHSFSYSDGSVPVAGVVQGLDGSFYGVTYEGGAYGDGTIFKLTPAGTFTTLYSFTGGSDGGHPWGGLLLASDGNLYGTTQADGTYGGGTVFQITPGGVLNTLVQFDGYNGANPSAALIQADDGSLYGTTQTGGTENYGVIFRVVIGGPLRITGQPEDQSVYLGGTATFTVATSGGAPVSYQWQQDGVNLADGGNISGSATATLRITNVALADAALYSVVVSNAINSVTSDYAVLEVAYAPPNITAQPASQACVAGTTATFTVGATGDQPLLYQWQHNGTNLVDGGNLSGATTSTLVISGVTMAHAGNYAVTVSNTLFGVASKTATLTVIPATAPAAAASVLRLLTGGNGGAFPYAGLIQGKDGYLYGMTAEGGFDSYGTIFRMTLSGDFGTFYGFTGNLLGVAAYPYARLAQGTNGYFYGTTEQGGTHGYGYGMLFSMIPSTFGTVKYLYSFSGGADGGLPLTGLTPGTDGNFYGASQQEGADAYGTIYKMTPAGAVTVLHGFTNGPDGAYPYCNLFQSPDGNLYGTTAQGGVNGYGTVFGLTTNGALTTLAAFNYTNGAYPEAGVIQGVDGNFYGTTLQGGAQGYGTVFCLGTNGTLTTLCSFGDTNGRAPRAELVQGSDGNLYGTCSAGGAGGQGTAFKITTNGVLTTLLWFDGLNGAYPVSALVQATDGNFYGTTPFGGTGFNPSSGGGYGTIYRLTVPLFTNRQFLAGSAVACLPYSDTLAGRAVAPTGDTLAYAKTAGPAWLNVATNGLLSGTPANSDIGTNLFVVSLTDTNGVSASASLSIVVTADPPPWFLTDPFAEPWANVNEAYAGTIATNALARYITMGDRLSFARVSGPAWLNVAADGTLSGTPDRASAGTNLFVVSVADLGGSSNTATLSIYVNSAPLFTPASFAKPAATAGVPYTGTIATNAYDPDAIAGDTLSFYKVTGPAWLRVATDGTLSGTPAGPDVGPGSFLMLVVDSGGLAAVGNLSIGVAVAQLPVWLRNPLNEPAATAGQTYSATLATNVINPNYGDALIFAKISGPAWLSVTANGGLSGLPLSTNAGANNFVVSVSELSGLSTNATMVINVTATPMIMTLSKQAGSLLLGWSGGVPPYQAQFTTNPLVGSWQAWGSPTTQTNLMLWPTNSGAFYRVQGQ